MSRNEAHERRLREGQIVAARALVLDAIRSHSLNTPFKDVELRTKPDGTGGERLLFTGYFSVTEHPYRMSDWLGEYSEVTRSGFLKTTLSQSPDVPFLLNHGGTTMARTKPGTLRLSEDHTGGYSEADLDPSRSDVQILRSGIDGGELDEMSFAFRVTRQQWSPDYDQRDILEVDIHQGDVSVVNFGANDGTAGYPTLRARQARALARSTVPALLADPSLGKAGDELRRGIVAALEGYRAADPGDSDLIAQLLGVKAEDPAPAEAESPTREAPELGLTFAQLVAESSKWK